MKKITLITILALIVLMSFQTKSYSQYGVKMSIENLVQTAANQVRMDIYITTTGTSGFTHYGSQFWITYTAGFMNAGTGTGTIVSSSITPAPASITWVSASNAFRVNSGAPGAGTVLTTTGDSVLAVRFTLQTSVASFAAMQPGFVLSNTATQSYVYRGVGTKVSPQSVASYLPNTPLPVELASFTSSSNGRDVNLKWQTTKEINNSGFDVERKATTGSWTTIGYVKGSGTTNNTVTYNYSDKKLNAGKYTYRLKQIDYNGNFEYYTLNSDVNVGVPVKFDLSQNYPNPFNPVTKIDYQLPNDSKVMMKLYDEVGREVMTLLNEKQTAGYYTITLNASSLSSGVYFYRLNASGDGKDFVITKKLMVVK